MSELKNIEALKVENLAPIIAGLQTLLDDMLSYKSILHRNFEATVAERKFNITVTQEGYEIPENPVNTSGFGGDMTPATENTEPENNDDRQK